MERPLDTAQAAHERQLEAYRQLPPEERLRLAAEMSDEIRILAVMLDPELASAARDARRRPAR